MDPWMIVQTPQGAHVYDLSGLAGEDEDLAAEVTRIRLSWDAPMHADDPTTPADGWEFSLTFGRPHESLMRGAVEHAVGWSPTEQEREAAR